MGMAEYGRDPGARRLAVHCLGNTGKPRAGDYDDHERRHQAIGHRTCGARSDPVSKNAAGLGRVFLQAATTWPVAAGLATTSILPSR